MWCVLVEWVLTFVVAVMLGRTLAALCPKGRRRPTVPNTACLRCQMDIQDRRNAYPMIYDVVNGQD